MLDPDRASCIVWHDFTNPVYPELTAYIDGLALPLLHVDGTVLAVLLRGCEPVSARS